MIRRAFDWLLQFYRAFFGRIGWLLVVLMQIAGAGAGIGAFIFGYGKGWSYLSNDPQAGANAM